MWQVLKSPTDNKPNNVCIITDNGGACVSQHQNANAFMNMYKSVRSFNLTKEDRGVKRTPNRTLRTLEVTNSTWPGFTTSEVRAVLSNLNPLKAEGPEKIHPRLLHLFGPKDVSFIRQLFKKSWESTSIPHGWLVADI